MPHQLSKKINIRYCVFFSHVIDSSHTKFDFSKLEDCKIIVDQAYKEFLTPDSLLVSEKNGNNTAYNFRLRLRDLASVIEADDSPRVGDVGRLMMMWKRWSIMAHGMKGLSHYSKHLPRLVFLLEKILPKGLAHAIKHSLLLPTGDRDGHWVPKDQYLEQLNYSLKHLYNNSVSNTSSRPCHFPDLI